MITNPIYAVTNPIIDNSSSKIADPQSFFDNVIQTLLGIFLIVGVIYFIWHVVLGAYHLIATEGDKNKFQQAKDELTYALVGLVILFSLFALLELIGYIFGIQGLEDLTLTWPSL